MFEEEVFVEVVFTRPEVVARVPLVVEDSRFTVPVVPRTELSGLRELTTLPAVVERVAVDSPRVAPVRLAEVARVAPVLLPERVVV